MYTTVHGRFQVSENNKKLCPSCKKRMNPIMHDFKGVVWKCTNCGFEVCEHYKDPEATVWRHGKAWDN